ncbi:hypothetical protein [Streptomyces luteireticuli]|uniref:hypothetical protein n=1 Tax=Streptomyces luteireticuli TaxID=173858 RepID=UPI0035578B0A
MNPSPICPYGTEPRPARQSPRSPTLDWPEDLTLLFDGRRRGAAVAWQRAARTTTA